MLKLKILAALVAVLLMAGTSFAQDPGDVGVFFDAAGTAPTGAFPTNLPTNVYVVAFDLAGDLFGYEFQFEAPVGLFTLNATLTNPEATRFGSGWAWLACKDGKLEVLSSANQDSPLMNGSVPILGLDVWEHAYYLKYQNRRPDYISAFWNVVNWDAVSQRY